MTGCSPSVEKSGCDGLSGKVLVVDDMTLHLETAGLYLEESGYQVQAATNTRAAWRLVAEGRPDLVLLDVVLPAEGDLDMPRVNGLNLLTRIKSEFPEIAVIIMTAFGSEEMAAAAVKLGAAGYISKPLRYSSLGDIVEKALARQREINSCDVELRHLKVAYEQLQVNANSILQCMSNCVVGVDNNLRIQTINQAAKNLARVEEDATGMYFYDVFPFFSKYKVFKKIIHGGQSARSREICIFNQDECRIFNLNADAVFDYQGCKIGAVLVLDDVTDLRRQEKILREQERMAIVGQMAAGVVHEIKNPMTTIKGFAQLLDIKSTDATVKKYVGIMLSEIERMNQVVQDFLQLARPKAAEIKLMDLNEVVREISASIEPHAYQNNTSVKMNICAGALWCMMDANQIKQVVLNLVQNAIDAMPGGGVLVIETALDVQTGEIRLDVGDTGCGIAASQIEKLRVPFFTSKPQGTGLGLSISYDIMDRHDGRVEVCSVLDGGTTFSLFFPAASNP